MYPELHRSFSELRLQVHENIGVLVDGDLVALRTIITGTHTGDYACVAPTGSPVQTSASHVFRIRDDQFVEHWPVVDTYRILVAIGADPPGRQCIPADPGRAGIARAGCFRERVGTEFSGPEGLPITREESRAVVPPALRRRDLDRARGRRRYWSPKAISRTRAGRRTAVPPSPARLAISRGAMPDGRALQTHIVAENSRAASRSVWDGTIDASPAAQPTSRPSTSSASRTGLIAEHWESVDWVRAYQSFGLLPDGITDA